MSEMMKTEKLNELLGEVIHIACAAELASDEQIKVQAIGDIYDALASVLPVDHGTKTKFEGEGEEKAVREGADRTGEDGKKYINLSLPNGFALAAFIGVHKIAAVGRTMPGGSEAEIYKDGVCELTMRTPRGKCYLYKVVREAMYGVVSRAGKRARHRKNVADRTGEEA